MWFAMDYGRAAVTVHYRTQDGVCAGKGVGDDIGGKDGGRLDDIAE